MAYRRYYFTGGQVTTPSIVEGAVTEEKIADNAVTSAKIKDETITGADIGAGQVQTQDIADGAVTQAKLGPDVSIVPLADNSVSTAKIQDNAVVEQKIANGAVTSDKLPSGAVTSLKIADGAVVGSKLATNSVTAPKIAPNAVGYSELAPQSLEPRSIKTLSGAPATEGQVPVADLSQGNQWWFRWASVATRPLTPAIASEEIAAGAVTQEKLGANAVGSSQLAVDSVSTEKIQNGAVTQEKLASGVGGDRFVFGTLLTGFTSADVLYLTNISADIPYTPFDLSPWVPAQAKAVILQLGMFNQAFISGRAFFRVRTNTDQRDALGLGNMVGANSQVANQGIVPLVVGTGPRTIEYTLESVGGPWVGTLTLWVTVVGYIT
ncbi:MAG: hypothetical protein AB1599_05950 [Planctomycetota bacterium]